MQKKIIIKSGIVELELEKRNWRVKKLEQNGTELSFYNWNWNRNGIFKVELELAGGRA